LARKERVREETLARKERERVSKRHWEGMRDSERNIRRQGRKERERDSRMEGK